MSIKRFELMHGAVLAKICRNDNPVALTLIESDGTRATYRINDIYLYIKHSTSPVERVKNGVLTWQYTFTASHLRELSERMNHSGVYLALVCASTDLSEDMEIAFLSPDEVTTLLDLATPKTQSVRVHVAPRKQMRVYGRDQELIVERRRLETWNVPNR